MIGEIVAAFDALLQANSCDTCSNDQVSMPALCALNGHNGKTASTYLQKSYRKYAKANNLAMPTMRRRNDISRQAKTSWINVQDAASFLRSRIKKNSETVNNLLHALDTNGKVQEAVAEKDKELEQEREEHATQQEFDQAAIQTLSNENKELKKRAGRDWKLLDSLPLEKRGKFSAILTSEKAVLAALEASKEIDKHLKATTSEFKDIRYDMCGVQKGTTTRMMNQSHLKPKQVRECLESAGADCGLLIQSSKKTDLRDNKTKLAILAKAAECTGVYKYLQRTKAREEEINKVDEGYIKPQWEDEANKKTTTCLLSAYAYDSGLETDRCRNIKVAKYFLDNHKEDPTGWPQVKVLRDIQASIGRTNYLSNVSAYSELRRCFEENKLSLPHGITTTAKEFWKTAIKLCKTYAPQQMPSCLLDLLRRLNKHVPQGKNSDHIEGYDKFTKGYDKFTINKMLPPKTGEGPSEQASQNNPISKQAKALAAMLSAEMQRPITK